MRRKRCLPPVNKRIFDKDNAGMGAAKDSRVSLFTEISLSILSERSALFILLAIKNKIIANKTIKLL